MRNVTFVGIFLLLFLVAVSCNQPEPTVAPSLTPEPAAQTTTLTPYAQPDIYSLAIAHTRASTHPHPCSNPKAYNHP